MKSSSTPLPRFVCCIHDRSPRRRVETLLHARGVEVMTATWGELLGVSERPRWQALVYDLSPWDGRSLQIVGQAVKVAPAAPVLLYPPHVPGVGSLLEQCARYPQVHLMLQFADGQESVRLAAELDRLRHGVPCEELLHLLRAGLQGVPARAWMYIESGVRLISQRDGDEHLSASTVAATMGISMRTLERAFDRTRLPRPKELLNWLVLLCVTQVAERTGWSIAAAARALNRQPNDVYRLQHRMLNRRRQPRGSVPLIPEGRPFDPVLVAFLRRCDSREQVGDAATPLAG